MGHGNKGEYGNSRVYFEGTLTYARTFGKHDVDALFLYNQQSYDNGSVQPYRKQGIAGRLSYTFDIMVQRILLKVNVSAFSLLWQSDGYCLKNLSWIVSEIH